MTAFAQRKVITEEEYLALEEESDVRHEFVDGQIYAMAGGSRPHVLITGNIGGEIRQALKGTDCEVYTIDLRVRVASSGEYLYPDAAVVCAEAVFTESKNATLTNPLVVIEVLSPSTELYDRVKKFEKYRSLPSLREYVLISQDRVMVEHHARNGETWQTTYINHLGAVLQFHSIPVQVSLEEIYRWVEFPAETEEE